MNRPRRLPSMLPVLAATVAVGLASALMGGCAGSWKTYDIDAIPAEAFASPLAEAEAQVASKEAELTAAVEAFLAGRSVQLAGLPSGRADEITRQVTNQAETARQAFLRARAYLDAGNAQFALGEVAMMSLWINALETYSMNNLPDPALAPLEAP